MSTEREAVAIVRAEESARGWSPGELLSQRQQRIEGCDFFTYPPDGGPPHAIEVKGWGDPLVDASGSPTYGADVNAEQLARARRDPNWRLEIVANLTAVRAGHGVVQRVTLSASEVSERAKARKFEVRLDGLMNEH